MAGEPDIVEKCKKGHKAGDKTFKVHIDGYNLLDFLTKEGVRSPRKGFVYFNDDGDIVALRFDNWKVVFMEQRVEGTMRIWAEPFVTLRVPKVFNLRTDPYERADITSNSYYEWFLLPRLHRAGGVGHHRAVPRDVQGVPAASEARLVLAGPGAAADERCRERRGTLTRPSIDSRVPVTRAAVTDHSEGCPSFSRRCQRARRRARRGRSATRVRSWRATTP